MRIIVLRGNDSCGKTTTLNIVYRMFLEQGGVSTNRQPLGGNQHDFSDIVLWNNNRIAFFTMGDYSGHLIEAINDYNAQNIDLLVCACNNRRVKPIRLIASFTNHMITKTTATNVITEQQANQLDAQTIYDLI